MGSGHRGLALALRDGRPRFRWPGPGTDRRPGRGGSPRGQRGGGDPERLIARTALTSTALRPQGVIDGYGRESGAVTGGFTGLRQHQLGQDTSPDDSDLRRQKRARRCQRNGRSASPSRSDCFLPGRGRHLRTRSSRVAPAAAHAPHPTPRPMERSRDLHSSVSGPGAGPALQLG